MGILGAGWIRFDPILVENSGRVGSQRKFWELFYQMGKAPYTVLGQRVAERTLN